MLICGALAALIFLGKKSAGQGRWGLYFGVCRNFLWYHARSMVVPYCYQCAPAAQPAILSIANAYSSQPLTEERRADWYAAAAKVEHARANG